VRKLEIAEVILSLAADRERATSIAGDLLEESRGRELSFWWLVAQTLVLQTGRQLSTAPFGIYRAGVLALLWQTIHPMSGGKDFMTGLVGVLRPVPGFPGDMFAWLFIPFWLGIVSARWHPGREYPIIGSWLGLHAILNVAASLYRWEFMGAPGTLANEMLVGLAWFAVFAPVSFLIATGAAASFRGRYKSPEEAERA
jgi:hypothetical protein